MKFLVPLYLTRASLLLGGAFLSSFSLLASPSAIGDNSGPPALQVQNEAKALAGAGGSGKSDSFTGSYGYSIPIEGAPARNGTQPPLALVYSSGGGNGWCGVGWNLEIGYIERNTQDGSPVKYNTSVIPEPMSEYDGNKGFIANIFGRSIKLKLVAGSEYRAEVDTTFSRFIFNTSQNRWEMYDKSGNVYFFGKTTGARIVNPKAGWTGDYRATFRWALDEIQTATGDQTKVTYTVPTGTERMIYPNQISYNEHVSRNGYGGILAATHTITFATDTTRTDKSFSYRSGFRIEHNRRLTTITCAVNGQQVRRYVLGYGAVSTATKRSLLRTFNVYGADNTPLPTQNFTYQGNTVPVSFQAPMNWDQMYLATQNNVSERCLIGTDNGATIYDLIDIDGDGLPDRVRRNNTGTLPGSPPDNYLVQRNLGLRADGLSGRFDNSVGSGGSGFAFGPTSTANIPKANYWSALNSPNLRFLDVNRDGLPDRVADDSTWMLGGTFTYTKFFVQTNRGGDFSTSYAWPVDTSAGGTGSGYPFAAIEYFESASLHAAWLRLLDINGDGYPDRLMAQRNTPRNSYLVELGTGNGFEMNGANPLVKKFGPFSSQGITTSSLNWFGPGSDYVYLADMNGDGLVDRVMLPKSGIDSAVQGSGLNKFIVEYNNGYSFEQGPADWLNVNPQHTTLNPIRYSYPQLFPRVGLFDINGDGLPDRVMTKEGDPTKWLVQLNTGTSFETGTGYEVSINNQGRTAENDVGWFGIQGDHSGQTVTAMLDMDGDGLLDRVMADYSSVTVNGAGSPWIKVQRNAGPFPDLLTGVNNGIGGLTTVAYKPSTVWDNRSDPGNPNSGKLLPFPIQTVISVSENDGVNPTRTTTYTYEGGYFDGSRRENAGFAKVTVTDPSTRKQIYYFHQGGGRDYGTLGEYADAGSFAKRGMTYRIETYGNDTPTPKLYNVVVNQVDQFNLGNGRWFPFVYQTFNYDYPGDGTPKITGTRFAYDNSNGNLTKQTLYGQVGSVTLSATTLATPSDTLPADTRYNHISYATITGNTDIKDRPAIVKLTSDLAGNTVIQEKTYTYNSPSGSLATEQTRICPGEYAVVTHDQYNGYGLPTRVTDSVGVQTITTYDSTYQIYPNTTRVRVTPNVNTDGPAGDHVTTATYDARSGAILTTTDAMGINYLNTYDPFFRLKKTEKGITPGGLATALWVKQVDYSLGGMTSGNSANYIRVRTQDGMDAANGFDTWTYTDGFGRPIQTKTESEVATQYRAVNTVYNERGEAFLTTWPRIEGNANFSKPPTTANQPVAYTGYDAAGRVNLTHPRANATFTFNGSGIQTVTTSFTGAAAGDGFSPLAAKQCAYVYNGDPWWIVCTDEDTKVRRYRMDAFGHTNRIEEVDGASTYATTLNYDLAGNLTQIINNANDSIYYGYDDAGNLVAMADPHLGQWTYKRDRAGRIREQVDGKGQKVVFTYGATLSRLSTKQVYNAAAQLVSTATYSYDSGDANHTVYKGQLFQVNLTAPSAPDTEYSEKNGYDTRGRLQKTTLHLDINNQDYVTSYNYNDGDKVTSIVYPNSGPTVNYAYHPSGTLYRVHKPSGYNYYRADAGDYDALGHVTRFYYRNGATSASQTFYPISQRLQYIQSSGIINKEYRYTAGSDVSYLSGTTITYDNLHRIKTYSSLSGTYNYDSVGNMTANIESGVSQTYDYGARRGQAVKTVTASGYSKKYLYDKCGNMIVRRGDTAGSQALEYDAENRLVRLSQAGSLVVEYGYAADGQRLWKRSSPPAAGKLQVWIGKIYEEKDGKTLFHVYAGPRLVCSFEPGTALAMAGESEPSRRLLASTGAELRKWMTPQTIAASAFPLSLLGLTVFAGRPTKRNRNFRVLPWWQRLLSFWMIFWLAFGGAPLIPLPQAYAQAYTPVAYYYYADHLGSSSVLTDANGAVVENNTYLPFGRAQGGNSSAFEVSRQFTGQVLDSETGLYYYGARYYDPELGRFIQPDTIIPDLSNPQSYNRYSYVLNNPLKHIDPDGHIAIIVAALLVGLVGGGAAFGVIKAQESAKIAASNDRTAHAMDTMVTRSSAHHFVNFNDFKLHYESKTGRSYGGSGLSAGTQEQIASMRATTKAGAEIGLELNAAVAPLPTRSGMLSTRGTARLSQAASPKLGGDFQGVDGVRKFVYNKETREFWIASSPTDIHPGVLGDANQKGGWPWTPSTNLREQYVGGHMWFKDGKPTGGHNLVSGAFEGSQALRGEVAKDLNRLFGSYGVQGKIQTR